MAKTVRIGLSNGTQKALAALFLIMSPSCVTVPTSPEPTPAPIPAPVPVPTPIPIPIPTTQADLKPTDSWNTIRTTLTEAKSVVITLAPGVYKAVGTIFLRNDSVTIKGAGVTWDGTDVKGRDCFQIYGADVVIDGLKIENCRADSSAAVRTLDSAARTTIRNCELTENMFGVSGMGTDVVVESNNIHHNHGVDSSDDHHGHGLYIYSGTWVVRGNNIHDNAAQNIHARGADVLIDGNTFGPSGSYQGDAMPCSWACGSKPLTLHHVWKNNTFDLGAQDNHSQVIALYYDEQADDGSADTVNMVLEFSNNTVRGTSKVSPLIHLLNGSGPMHVILKANAVTGVKDLYQVDAPSLKNWTVEQ